MLLILAPWTAWWQRNYFADVLPWVQVAMTSNLARGVVMVAGSFTALAGIVEAITALAASSRAAETPPS